MVHNSSTLLQHQQCTLSTRRIHHIRTLATVPIFSHGYHHPPSSLSQHNLSSVSSFNNHHDPFLPIDLTSSLLSIFSPLLTHCVLSSLSHCSLLCIVAPPFIFRVSRMILWMICIMQGYISLKPTESSR